MTIKESEYITFHWLKTLSGKQIRIGDIEGEYKGGVYKCCTKGKVSIKVDNTWITLEGRKKDQITLI